MTKELPFKIEFIGYVRIDLLSIWPEQLEILPESGLSSCHFGIESFDPLSCNMIGKGWGAKNNKKFLKYIGETWGDDVIVNVSMIAGLGKETEKDWEESNDWLTQSKVHDWNYNKLYIAPKLGLSEFEKEPEKYGYRFNGATWETDFVTEERARDWCENNPKKTRAVRIPSVWNYSALRNIGIERDVILNSNYEKIHKLRKEQNLTDIMINKYYNKAMEY
jgi:radical SAM superfamily enzyme YgiQ (UPF0313 family)